MYMKMVLSKDKPHGEVDGYITGCCCPRWVTFHTTTDQARPTHSMTPREERTRPSVSFLCIKNEGCHKISTG